MPNQDAIVAPLDLALAQAAGEAIAENTGRAVPDEMIVAWIAHRSFLDDGFWTFWDMAVRDIAQEYAKQHGMGE